MTNQVFPEAALRVAESTYIEKLTELRLAEGAGFKVVSQQRRAIRAALEAAAPHMARVIAGYDDLEDLPVETVIRTNLGTVREKNSLGYWYAMGDEDANGIERLAFPATIIYQP